MAKVLCVEDEPEIRDVIVEELIDFGHDVETAEDGKLGLEAALQFQPDVILSDFLMPRMTGPEMIRTLRDGHPEFSATPCVVISAYANDRHRSEATEAGVTLYLTKPIDFDRLELALNDLLSGKREA